jgi:3-hydroxybutyryl-CoA dehydratase
MDWRVGDCAQMERRISEGDVRAFSQLTSDANEVHLPDGTRSRGLVQGAFLSGLAAGLVGTSLPGPGCIYVEQSFEYLLPVYASEAVVVRGTIARVDEATRRLTIAIRATNELDEDVMLGSMLVQLGRRRR